MKVRASCLPLRHSLRAQNTCHHNPVRSCILTTRFWKRVTQYHSHCKCQRWQRNWIEWFIIVQPLWACFDKPTTSVQPITQVNSFDDYFLKNWVAVWLWTSPIQLPTYERLITTGSRRNISAHTRLRSYMNLAFHFWPGPSTPMRSAIMALQYGTSSSSLSLFIPEGNTVWLFLAHSNSFSVFGDNSG